VIGPAPTEGVSIEITDEFTLHSDRSKNTLVYTQISGLLWSEWTEEVERRGRERGSEWNKKRWKGRNGLWSEY